MTETLLQITRLVALVFFVASMGGTGLGLTWSRITAPLRNTGFVVRALLANFICAPLLAVGIASALNLGGPFATGLLLLGLGAGAPFMPRVAGLAHGDPALAVALTVLSMAGTLVFMPMVLPLVLGGVEVDSWRIAGFLLGMLLLPLAAGMILKAFREPLAARLRPVFDRLAGLALLLVVVLILTIHRKSVPAMLGTGALAAAVLFSGSSALAGWFLGGGQPSWKVVLCLGTGLRNLPAALVVGGQNFPDPGVTVMVLVSTLVGLLILVPVALIHRNRLA